MLHCIDCAITRLSGQGLATVGLVLIGLLPTGCASLEKSNHLIRRGGEPVTNLPGWSAESAGGLRQALQTQCTLPKLSAPWPTLCADLAGMTVPPEPELAKPRTAADQPPVDQALKQWIRKHFEAWQLTNKRGAGAGLLTGYYEPLLTGSLQRESSEQVALFAPPSGTIGTGDLPSREQIETGQASALLAGRHLLWLDDPIEAFFLHIQGSGRIQLRSGEIVRAGYAGHNGRKYYPVGRALIEQGEIARKDMSADRIRQWMRKNPADAQKLMWRNERYIFFKLVTGLPPDRGPIGSMQVPLTSFRSVATDKRFLPPGALVYVDTRLPARQRPGVGLALTQDTGSAIRGPVRADLFTGTGEQAGALAGGLKQPMRMWLLWPKGKVPPPKIPVARFFANP